MSKTIRRALAAAAISAVGLAGAVSPAHAASTTVECDPAALSTAIANASADARAAQRAYAVHTKTSVQALTKQIKSEELREARTAAKLADRATRIAARASGKQARKDAAAMAHAARAVARAEAKESARVQRASLATLRSMIKTDRTRLKTEWTSTKVALQTLLQQAEDCAAIPAAEPKEESPAEIPVI